LPIKENTLSLFNIFHLNQNIMSEDLKRIYIGSRVEAMFLKEMLEENGIGCIFKDILASSIQSGWAEGTPTAGARLFVESFNEENAKKILEEYFESRDKD